LKKYTPWKQEETKRKNREAVLKILRDGDKRFKDLKRNVNFSETTLSNALDKLEADDLIKIILVGKHAGYTLTKRGEKAYDEIFLLSDILDEIKSRKGKYLSGGVPLQKSLTSPLFWPMTVHMAADKTIQNVLLMMPKENLFSIQEELLSKIIRNIKMRNLTLDEKKQGMIVIGFGIDYSDLAKTVKNNSLKKWKKLWNEEQQIPTIWLQDSISGDKKTYILPFKIISGETKI